MQTEAQETDLAKTQPQSQTGCYHSRFRALSSICLSFGIQLGAGLERERWKQPDQRGDHRLSEYRLRWQPCPCPIFAWPRTRGCFSPSSPVLVGFGTSSIMMSVT